MRTDITNTTTHRQRVSGKWLLNFALTTTCQFSVVAAHHTEVLKHATGRHKVLAGGPQLIITTHANNLPMETKFGGKILYLATLPGSRRFPPAMLAGPVSKRREANFSVSRGHSSLHIYRNTPSRRCFHR
jgi:hypothetical protein